MIESSSDSRWIEVLLRPSDDGDHRLDSQPSDATVRSFMDSLPEEIRCADDPFVLAVLGAALADRVSFATVCGHQAAIRRLVPDAPRRELIAFCASEQSGAHPRGIETSLSGAGEGLTLSGKKRWATLSPVADRLLVVASVGWQGERNRLALVSIPSSRAGVEIRPMPATEFTPEITHAEIDFTGVSVSQEEVLPGDGYLDAVKPFRTIEDVLIAASVVTYNLRLAVHFEWPDDAREELLLLLVAARELVRQDPSAAAHHLAVAGWNRISRDLRERHRARDLWRSVPEEIERAFVRDTSKSVAARARELRRRAAWQTVSGEIVG